MEKCGHIMFGYLLHLLGLATKRYETSNKNVCATNWQICILVETAVPVMSFCGCVKGDGV
jgi:hypothetical protein